MLNQLMVPVPLISSNNLASDSKAPEGALNWITRVFDVFKLESIKPFQLLKEASFEFLKLFIGKRSWRHEAQVEKKGGGDGEINFREAYAYLDLGLITIPSCINLIVGYDKHLFLKCMLSEAFSFFW